jgi:hypothetical protein
VRVFEAAMVSVAMETQAAKCLGAVSSVHFTACPCGHGTLRKVLGTSSLQLLK